MITWRVGAIRADAQGAVAFVSLVASEGGQTESCEVKLGPPGNPFTALSDLTEQQVLDWALPLAPVDRVAENLSAAQARAALPAPTPMPWVPSEESVLP